MIVISLAFHQIPTMPKEDGIYWCIVKWTNRQDKRIEYQYHYIFVGFENGVFDTGNPDIEVMAWCELENPASYFEQKMRIIH